MSIQELKDGIAEAIAQGNRVLVEELSRKLREHINRKLEERTLDIAGMPRGAAGDDIEELRDLARETGNLDALYILDAKAEEIGWAQIKRTLAPIRRIEQREKRLEDYLAQGNNLERVQEGLKFRSRQEVLHSGRLDIVAEDRNAGEVVVELKAGDYDSGNVFHQLVKYAGERPDSKVLFIAPRIKADLVMPLSQLPEGNRIRFYEVREDGKDYSFKPVDKSSFGDAPDQRWTFGSRRGNGRQTGVVKFVRAERGSGKANDEDEPIARDSEDSSDKPSPKIKVVPDENLGRLRGERIVDSRFSPNAEVFPLPAFASDPASPLYYRALGNLYPETLRPEKFLDKIQVERKQLAQLEDLARQGPSIDKIEKYAEKYKSPSDRREQNLSPKNKIILGRALSRLSSNSGIIVKMGRKLDDGLEEILDGMPDLNSLHYDERRVSRLGMQIIRLNDKVTDLMGKKVICEIREDFKKLAECGEFTEESRREMEWLASRLDKEIVTLGIDYLQTKFRRARKLAEVDPEMASLYLAHTPKTSGFLSSGPRQENESVKIKSESGLDFNIFRVGLKVGADYFR